MQKPELRIKNLKVSIEGQSVLEGVNLKVNSGEIHALMGPNGSGKSTLALTIAGHPSCKISEGGIYFKSKNISNSAPEERAKLGIFLAFQNPVAVEGVSVFNFLKSASCAVGSKISPSEFLEQIKKQTKLVGLGEEFLRRDLNLGFSGGERKRFEVLQALVLRPRFAAFDEIDSGLDVDALKNVAKRIKILAKSGTGVLVVTHYQRILKHLKPDKVHVLVGGIIVESGGPALAAKLERSGYKNYR